MDLSMLYHANIPPVLARLCETAPMRRLQDVGMNCGCEYTSFAKFRKCASYSRYDHSLGVGLIVWHFTQDEKQAVAGLLHDISTPVFAHVVDFMNGDYMTQESTELDTKQVICASSELLRVLEDFGLSVKEVCDYHIYPIADNDTPRLSSDRLEYTFGNALNYGFVKRNKLVDLYRDLMVGTNEDGAPELMFRTPELALFFARTALACSKVYVSDEDRFAMEALANRLKSAISRGVLTRADLMRTEKDVISKLCEHPDCAADWKQYRSFSELLTSEQPQSGEWYHVSAKKRHIDPMIQGCGRVSAVFPEFSAELTAYLSQPFDCYLSAK